VYVAYEAGNGFLFHLMAVPFSVFLILEIGLDPLQLVLMGTILEVTYLLFEVPTGIVADTVSRRLSVTIGVVGTGLAFVLLGLAGSFLVAAASQVLWGLFATFTSGADVAWLTDEIGESAARPVYARADQAWHAAGLVGIALAVGLASIDLRLPFVASGIGYVVLGVAIRLNMTEEGFVKPERRDGERFHQGLLRTVRAGMREARAHPILLLILAAAALHGASTEGFDRLSDLHVLCDVRLPGVTGSCAAGSFDVGFGLIVWFGILDGVAMLLGIGGLQVVKRIHLEGHARGARVLAVVDLALIATVVVFALVGEFWAAAGAFWLVGALRSVREPIFTAWINQGLDPATRATINSLGAQADAIGQAGGGPVLGLIARRGSVPAAVIVSGLLRAPALVLYALAIRRGSIGTVRPDEMDPELEIEA
jgi:DHA3 family tetracycline resistance protein-like MFS transporter